MIISKDIAERMIEELINDGEKLLLIYQEYDKSIRSEVIFYSVEYNDFPSIGEVGAIYYSVDTRKKCVDIRVYEKVKSYWLDQQFYPYRYFYSEDELLGNEIKPETATKIIRELSLNSTVLFRVFNLEEYKTWERTCEQKLSKISAGEDWFKKAKKAINLYNPTPDKDVLESFEAQIAALKTTLELLRLGKKEMISKSTDKRLKIISSKTKGVQEALNFNVQENRAFIFDRNIIIEDGDFINRSLPNGIQEEYFVVTANFLSDQGDPTMDHYECEIEKISTVSKPSAFQPQGQNITHTHIHAHNSTVNVNSPNSIQHSNNTNNANLFSNIRNALENGLKDDELKKSVIPLVSELEQSVGSASYKDKLVSFMTHAATFMTIIGPFLPELAKLST